jgi:hypothetical protein
MQLYGKKGEDLKAWLFQAEEQFSLLTLTDDDLRIRIAGMALRGPAKTWYHSVRSDTLPDGERLVTWDAFKTALMEQFSPVEPIKRARDQLADLKQDGSVRDYTSRFRQLCTIITNISEAEKLDRYVRGLRQRIKSEVELRDPETFAEATKLAEKVDSSLDRVYPKFSGGFRKPPPVQNRRADGPAPMDLGVMQKGGPNQQKPRGPLTSEERARR